MKGTNKLLIGVGMVALAGFIIYAMRRDQSKRKLERIAEEGYETANDILFPGMEPLKRRLRYGPVLPE